MAGNNPGAGAPAFPPVPVVGEVWKTTPFSFNFNPGTKFGNIIFIKKTKGLPESARLDLTKKKSQKIHKYLLSQENSMVTSS